MKYSYIILFLISFPLLGMAQSIDRWVLASQGDYVEAGSMSLSYSVGEVVMETEETPAIVLTQGFQQPEQSTVGLEFPEMKLSINAYPNPTSDKVVVELEMDQYLEIDLSILNSQGKLVGHQEIKSKGTHKEVLNFSKMAAGVYLLHLRNANGAVKTLKVEKLH